MDLYNVIITLSILLHVTNSVLHLHLFPPVQEMSRLVKPSINISDDIECSYLEGNDNKILFTQSNLTCWDKLNSQNKQLPTCRANKYVPTFIKK